MIIKLKDEGVVSFLTRDRHSDDSFRGFSKEILLTALEEHDKNTAQILRKSGINLLLILCIGGKPVQHFKNKPKFFNTDYLFRQALRGKQLSYFKIASSENAYFGDAEPILLELDFDTDSKRILRLKKKLAAFNKRARKTDNRKLSTYRNTLNLEFIKRIVTVAKNEYAFILRYNNEMLCAHINVQGKKLSVGEIEQIYADYVVRLDLTQQEMRCAFAALYGSARGYFSFFDMYTVGGIFSFDNTRTIDDQKRRAGREMLGITVDSKLNLQEVVEQICDELLKIPLPPLDIDNLDLIKQNYSIYKGLGACARLVRRLSPSNVQVLEYAEQLLGFEMYDEYYEHIGELGALQQKEDIRKFERGLTKTN